MRIAGENDRVFGLSKDDLEILKHQIHQWEEKIGNNILKERLNMQIKQNLKRKQKKIENAKEELEAVRIESQINQY